MYHRRENAVRIVEYHRKIIIIIIVTVSLKATSLPRLEPTAVFERHLAHAISSPKQEILSLRSSPIALIFRATEILFTGIQAQNTVSGF
jgi:hypothetical protein